MSTVIDRPRMYSDRFGALYASGMVRLVMLGVEAFRLRLKERLDVLKEGEETIIQRRGVIVGALITPDDYRFLREKRGDPTDL